MHINKIKGLRRSDLTGIRQMGGSSTYGIFTEASFYFSHTSTVQPAQVSGKNSIVEFVLNLPDFVFNLRDDSGVLLPSYSQRINTFQ